MLYPQIPWWDQVGSPWVDLQERVDAAEASPQPGASWEGCDCVWRLVHIGTVWLVVWNIFYFPINIGLLIIPIDFHIFQRGSNHILVLWMGQRNPVSTSWKCHELSGFNMFQPSRVVQDFATIHRMSLVCPNLVIYFLFCWEQNDETIKIDLMCLPQNGREKSRDTAVMINHEIWGET